MNKKYILIVIIIVALGVICGLAYNASIRKNDKNVEHIDTELIIGKVNDQCTKYSEILETNSTEEKISPNAILYIKKYYQKCKHTVTEKAQMPSNLVNLAHADLKKIYSDWQIETFSPFEVTIKKDLVGICGEHFVLKEKDGFITIYTLNNNEGLELKQKTEISTKYLTEFDLINLQKGIEAIGKENLNKLLEDYE